MKRVTFALRVKDGHQQEYIRRHQEVWPEVLTDLQRAGVHKMSMFLRGVEVFVYMEVDDYAEVVRILVNSPDSIRWEQHMAPIMEGADGNGYDAANPYPEPLHEIFCWNEIEMHRDGRHPRPEPSDQAVPPAPHFRPARTAPIEP
jgi:L-rhamnose mutarotase